MKSLFSLLIAITLSLPVFCQNDILSSRLMDVRSGRTMTFKDAIGKDTVTLIVFWDIRDIEGKKAIRVLRDKFPAWRENIVFNFITISTDNPKEKGLVDKYAAAQSWDFPYYIDQGPGAGKVLNFDKGPFTIIADKKGQIAYTHSGFKEGEEEGIWGKIKELTAK